MLVGGTDFYPFCMQDLHVLTLHAKLIDCYAGTNSRFFLPVQRAMVGGMDAACPVWDSGAGTGRR